MLSRLQELILDAIVEDPTVTVRELAVIVDMSSPASVQYHLDRLGRLGLVVVGRCECCGSRIRRVVAAPERLDVDLRSVG